MFQSKLPNLYWSYVVLHATFLINRVPTPLLKNKSPYQMLYDNLPDVNSFKVFGYLCYAFTLLAHRSKLHSRARKYVFLGYKSGSKGYVLFYLDTREIFLSINVVFHELILPYIVSSTHSNISNWHYYPSSQASIIYATDYTHTRSSTPPPPPSMLISPFLLLHLPLLHLHHLQLESLLEIKRLFHTCKIILFLLHILLLLMLIKLLIFILYPIFFLTTIYLTLNTFFLCLLFLKLNPNHMLRLSNLIVGNKQCNLNSMLLIRLLLGK